MPTVAHKRLTNQYKEFSRLLYPMLYKNTASLYRLPLLFRKRSRLRRLFACKRTHNAFGSLTTFCECAPAAQLQLRADRVYISCDLCITMLQTRVVFIIICQKLSRSVIKAAAIMVLSSIFTAENLKHLPKKCSNMHRMELFKHKIIDISHKT